MRSLRWPVVAAFAGIVACNSVEQGIPGGTGGGSGVDAGTSSDAGTGGTGGGGTVDAGPTSDAGSGMTADAGTDGTGNAADAGPVSDCSGLAPATLGTMESYAASHDSKFGVCGLPVGNGDGVIAHFVTNDPFPIAVPLHAPVFTLINRSGGVNGGIEQNSGGIFPVANGFLDWSFGAPALSSASQFVVAVDDSGRTQGTRTTFSMYGPLDEVFASDVNGGASLAGTIQVQGQKDQRRVMMFDATGAVRSAPRELSTDSPIFGLGVDLNGRTLVIQSGYAQCSGCILGQWFERNGAPLTDSFTLIAGFSPGPATWFETAPLIGGGLAIRRMDAKASGDLRGFTSTWLLTIESGSATVHPPPDWMTSRPNTGLALARNKSAYAVLANGQDGERCTQRLELLSPSGNACGSWDLTMADMGGCDNWDLRLGLDGTVLQRLPAQLERYLDSANRSRTCTVRFWPAALK